MKHILEAPFLIEMVRTMSNMYRLGWDERNSGNISLLLDRDQAAQYLDLDGPGRDIPTGFGAPGLDGRGCLVNGACKNFKNAQ